LLDGGRDEAVVEERVVEVEQDRLRTPHTKSVVQPRPRTAQTQTCRAPRVSGRSNPANPCRGTSVAFTRAATEGFDRQEIHDATTGGSDGGLR
jgi:hypothetical protein